MCRPLTLGEALVLALCTLGATSVDAELPKRVPSGFMGMRGKKQGSVEEVYEDFEKRVPGMDFQEMSGKKDDDAALFQDEPEYFEKRAPGSGFQGMRGKKEDPDVWEYFEKRAPGSGFQGMRGKKDFTDHSKRAPSMGFQGMRGKKNENEVFDKISVSSSEEKLGPSHATGNKYEDYSSMLDTGDVWGDGFDKRAPSGFMGMRGKKVPSGFMGMRGKKAPSGFMGMRGKKAPSGFMGMRGKKADGMDLESFLETLEAEELRDEGEPREAREKRYKMKANIKKAPSGFMGMRGKKWDSGYAGRGPQVADSL